MQESKKEIIKIQKKHNKMTRNLDQMNLTKIYRTVHTKAADTSSLQIHVEHSLDRSLLGINMSLKKFKKAEII